jgi:hypothetical protein
MSSALSLLVRESEIQATDLIAFDQTVSDPTAAFTISVMVPRTAHTGALQAAGT